MSGTKILWGQIALVLSIIVLSWWVATQWTAWELAFQPELGRPWFRLFHRWPVYAPPLFFWWWYVFDAYAPNVFARGAWIAGSGGVLAFAAAVALSVHRAREARKIETYGSARWAEPEEIAQAGLLDPDGRSRRTDQPPANARVNPGSQMSASFALATMSNSTAGSAR